MSWDIGTSKRRASFFNCLICFGDRYKAVLILRCFEDGMAARLYKVAR